MGELSIEGVERSAQEVGVGSTHQQIEPVNWTPTIRQEVAGRRGSIVMGDSIMLDEMPDDTESYMTDAADVEMNQVGFPAMSFEGVHEMENSPGKGATVAPRAEASLSEWGAEYQPSVSTPSPTAWGGGGPEQAAEEERGKGVEEHVNVLSGPRSRRQGRDQQQQQPVALSARQEAY